jgi:hypothetical protein
VTSHIPDSTPPSKIHTDPLSNIAAFFQDLLFESNPAILASPVSLNAFRDFTDTFEEKLIQITSENVLGLTQLCTEFAFPPFLQNSLHFVPPLFLKITTSSLEEFSNGID